MTTTDAGFTLIETLVAMAVLAVAATGLVRATEGHVDLIGALESRVAGGWAVDNALTEARLGLTPAPTTLLGQRWTSVVVARASDDPDVSALTVTAAGSAKSVIRHGFRDTAATTAAKAVTSPVAPTAQVAPADGRTQ